MTGNIAAAGDASTGGSAARTVDMHDDHGPADTGICLNCGTRLIGAHCHACGQSGHVHRTVGEIGHEIAHGVFHFEGRIWRTLPMLVVRPGELTRRYIAGERTRFVSPLALFLFTVFVMFALYSWVGPGDLSAHVARGLSNTGSGIAKARVEAKAAIGELEQQRAVALAQQRPTGAIDRRLASQRDDLRMLEQIGASTSLPGSVRVETRSQWVGAALERMRENPGLVAYKVQSSAYKFSWALILLSTPFVALLFAWRRRFGLYDHAIFVTYSIAFMSLLVIVLELALAMGIEQSLFWTVLMLVPPVHMFAQLRGAYGLSIVSAAWRTLFLLAFSVTILGLFVTGLVAMGVAH